MERDSAQKLARELKISINQIVREYWEMLILKELSQSKIGDYLVFVGGTVLRLAYNSPRFSDDLDFYLKKSLSAALFRREINFIAKKLNLQLTDLKPKYFTFLAEFKIKTDYLILPFRIKIEIRKKIVKNGWEFRLLNSATVNFDVLFSVLNLEKLRDFKKLAFKERREPRDLFDLWFISQQLKQPFRKPKIKIDAKEVKQVLSKYLPENFKTVIRQITK